MSHELIQNLVNKDFVSAKQVIEDLLREKISYKLNEARVDVANKMFNPSLDEAIKVSDDSKRNYEYANGQKPKGQGRWMFSTINAKKHDSHNPEHMAQTFTSSHGTFSTGAKEAAKHFKSMGYSGEIHVLT